MDGEWRISNFGERSVGQQIGSRRSYTYVLTYDFFGVMLKCAKHMYTTNVSVNEPCCREHVCTAEIKTNARGISTYTFKDLKEDCGETIPFSLYRPVGHLPIIPLMTGSSE